MRYDTAAEMIDAIRHPRDGRNRYAAGGPGCCPGELSIGDSGGSEFCQALPGHHGPHWVEDIADGHPYRIEWPQR
jgi:hypothetical protein